MLEGSSFAWVGEILQGERVADAKGEKRRRKDTRDKISEEARERKSLIIYPEGDAVGDSGVTLMASATSAAVLTGRPTNI
jgi:hypothetical protein